MLTFDKVIQTDFGSYVRGFCLPTDEKPVTGIANGSMLEEINPESGVVDTYRFDGENAEWVKIISDGTPSGGGGSGSGVAHVNWRTEHDDGTNTDVTVVTLDKTWREIADGGIVAVISEASEEMLTPHEEYASEQWLIIGTRITTSRGVTTYSVSLACGYAGANDSVDWGIQDMSTDSENGYPEYVIRNQ